MRFSVPNMSCGHCKSAIETAVNGADPAARITFDMDKRIVDIQSQASAADLQSAMSGAGYDSQTA